MLHPLAFYLWESMNVKTIMTLNSNINHDALRERVLTTTTSRVGVILHLAIKL
jgi:hypothetical protein